jgi:hypothetical protein
VVGGIEMEKGWMIVIGLSIVVVILLCMLAHKSGEVNDLNTKIYQWMNTSYNYCLIANRMSVLNNHTQPRVNQYNCSDILKEMRK